ncbi:pentapeptide repeat-containing protein [Thermococcus alcaliphilus]|uniref:pentapeptide repeat-containing protein n=1 Tax=Thermococcus alcaliphilus TaxID=139207 RepID=UPI002091C5D4|nr:pentapeptide repeat-containing protein [Thermococcus alcaliphilus]MCO6041848.1 pentapeptide repeat-containing protein [Thermococcus alcaliphilus]
MKLENGEEWECPLEALPGEEYCYWHKPEDGKTPSEEQIKELKNYRIMGIYLKEADLEEVHLERAYLVMANLKNADLTEANLKNADLEGSNLENADLSWANLKNATFLKAILEHAILNGADLEYADFRVADLNDADLEEAYLEHANLSWAHLKHANLTEANLENANLKSAHLENTNLSGAELDGANLSWAHLEHANLTETSFKNANLTEANLENADLRVADLKHADFRKANLKNADLGGSNLENANLNSANLEHANLWWANLKNANLIKASLKNAILPNASLERADLNMAHLENANLKSAHLEHADLEGARLEYANLEDTRLEYANLHAVLVSPATNFTRASLEYTNLHNSYVDQTPTLRDAVLFNKDTFMEINEIVAEFVKMKKVISLEKLQDVNEKLANELTERGLFYYVTNGEKVAIFDPYEGFIMNPDRHLLEKKKYTRRLKNALNYFIKNFKKEKGSSADIEDLKVISLIKEGKDILYENTPENLQKLYEASYEVYNKLYYFYIKQGKFEEALQMHYRRNEVRRKLRLTKGWGSKIRAVLYDWFLMKTLTGYGIKVERPLIASLITITLFAFLFKSTNGIVKLVNGKPVPADWIDYFYHSVITFTSLGYANIQPNLISHVPQILVAVESFLGLLLMSLFLYTVTFRISR